MRFVLAQDTNAPHPRIDAVGQCEIDDSKLAAKKHGRVGSPVGQLLEPAAATAGENQCDRPLRQSLLGTNARQHFRDPFLGVGLRHEETVREQTAGVNVDRGLDEAVRSARKFRERLQLGLENILLPFEAVEFDEQGLVFGTGGT